MGEAIAIAENKPHQVRTVNVNDWVWGARRPSVARQELIAELLEQPRLELFPPIPREPRVRPQPELELLSAARRRGPRKPNSSAAAALRASEAQEPLRAVSSTRKQRSIMHGKSRRKSARDPAPTAVPRAA
jgi:hypothetical protein